MHRPLHSWLPASARHIAVGGTRASRAQKPRFRFRPRFWHRGTGDVAVAERHRDNVCAARPGENCVATQLVLLVEGSTFLRMHHCSPPCPCTCRCSSAAARAAACGPGPAGRVGARAGGSATAEQSIASRTARRAGFNRSGLHRPESQPSCTPPCDTSVAQPSWHGFARFWSTFWSVTWTFHRPS